MKKFMAMIAMVICISIFVNIPIAFRGNSGVVSDITNWTAVGGTVTKTSDGYEVSKAGNSFAISDKKASVFSFETDLTILEGDRASIAYGLSSTISSGKIWRGVELKKTGNTTAEIKGFIEIGVTTINTVSISDVDWSQPVKFKLELGEDKSLKAYVNGTLVASGSDPTYESGYIGLLTWESRVLFNNIKFSGTLSEGGAVSDITNWTSVNGTITDKAEGYVLDFIPGQDNFAVSNKTAIVFTYEADIKIISGDGQRATLAYGIGSVNNLGAWRGVEVLKTSATTGEVKAFIGGGPNLIEPVALSGIDFNSPVNCKVTMDAERNIAVYINGEKKGEGKDNSFTGGYLGILTWNTKASFNNIKFFRDQDPSTAYLEKYRPQLHFSPSRNFMNDPNGLVFDPSNNTYHLFFQYNPTGLDIGNQVWGHAESTDLINWKQIEELAIIQDDGLGAIFSGSAVVDENNTSGFFSGNVAGESKLVAIFTHDGGDTSKGYEKQSIAYSKDHGHTWIKPTMEKDGFTNPVLSNENNKWGRDFRDPKVFWYDGQWMMVVAGGHARIFTSPNLRDWTEACDMGMDSECPDLFPLSVDGNDSNIKWVYTASGDWYVIGRLEKDTVVNGVQKYKFTAETERLVYNGGPEVYATQTFYNDGSNLNRRIAISWLQDNSASQLSSEGKIWNGAMSLPHVLGIKTVNGKMQLTSYPVSELENNRVSTPIYTASNKQVKASDSNILAGISGQKYDIEAVFVPQGATEFGFKLRKGIGEETIVKYNTVSEKFILDRSKAGKVMNGIHSLSMTPLSDGSIKMRIVVDTSIIEAFGNDGLASTSVYIFPDSGSIGMEFFTNGDITVKSMNIYDMKSIWNNELTTPDSDLYLSVPSTSVAVGDTIKIESSVFPMDDAYTGVAWNVSDSRIFQVVSSDQNSIVLKALKDGTCKITATAGTLQKDVTLTAFNDSFVTNLENLTAISGNWYKSENGMNTDGTNGDSFMISDTSLKTFSFTGDMIPKSSGGCIGLVFGVTYKDAPFSGTWYGANVDTNSAGDAVAKLFCNANGSEVWKVTKSIPKAEDNTYKARIDVSEEGKIQYWVNDILIGEKSVTDFKAGYMGLVTYNSSGLFNNIIAKTEDIGEPPLPPEDPIELTNIELSTGKLTPGFAKDIDKYSVNVSNDVKDISIKMIYTGWGKAFVNGVSVDNNKFSDKISLDVGDNVINLKLEDSDGNVISEITVNVIRADGNKVDPPQTGDNNVNAMAALLVSSLGCLTLVIKKRIVGR